MKAFEDKLVSQVNIKFKKNQIEQLKQEANLHRLPLGAYIRMKLFNIR